MAMTAMQAAERVSPLAMIVRGSLERWLSPSILEELAGEIHGHNYERKITLEALVAIMLDAVIGMQPSVHAAALARRDQWVGSLQALYGKLGRLDPNLATRLVQRTAAGIGPLLPKPQGPFGGKVKIIDGTMPNGTEHRLSVLRRLKAAGLPAQCVIVYDLASGLCERTAVSEDAYTNEKPLAEELLQEATAGEIYVGDRGFCTCRLMATLIDRQAFLVFREFTYDLVFAEEGERRSQGRCETGDVGEQCVHVFDRASKRCHKLRRILVDLDQPTEDGETEIRIITNLPRRYSAAAIADLYRRRWTIERHFHLIKHELHGELPSLGEPRAAIFALCLSLAAGNVLMFIKSLAERSKQIQGRALSGYYMALEIGHGYAAVEALTTVPMWRAVARLSNRQYLAWARRLGEQVPWKRLLTNPRGPKVRPPPRASGKHRHHYSTFRLKQTRKHS